MQKFVPTKAILTQACSVIYLKQALKHLIQHDKHLAKLAVFSSFESFDPVSISFNNTRRTCKTDNKNDPNAKEPAW